MIESGDRGITLNKSLAWTILVALVGGGFWVGAQVTTATNGLAVLQERQTEDRKEIRSNTQAINSLRQSNARIDERLANIERAANRTEQSVNELLRLQREERP